MLASCTITKHQTRLFQITQKKSVKFVEVWEFLIYKSVIQYELIFLLHNLQQSKKV